jgi:hypothetical protein
MIFCPSMLNNEEFWQVFQIDENIVEFLVATETTDQAP